MGKRYILCGLYIFCICMTAGCGNGQRDTESVPKENIVSVSKVSMEELQEQYPQWINTEGVITYPYTIESEEYKKAENYEKQCSLMDIPKAVVDNVGTDILLKAVEEYPISLDYYRFNTIDQAHENYSSVFYGYKVLFDRKDAYQEAWESLQEKMKDNVLESFDYNGNQDDKYMQEKEEINKMVLDFSLILTERGWSGLEEKDRKTVEEQAALLIKALGPIDTEKLVSGGDWDIIT